MDNRKGRQVFVTLFLLFIVISMTRSCSSPPKKVMNKTHVIEIKQMKFNPSELLVNVGDTVVWMNNDIVMHDVTAWPDKDWTSTPIPIGKSWNKIISKTEDYFCSIHTMMTGRIVVNDH